MILRKIAILILTVLLPLSMTAQKKKKRVVKKPVIEEPQEDPRITNMREMTQQILIIDSIVTDKDKVLPYLRISSDAGKLMSVSDFLGKQTQGYVYAFVNEMENKGYFSLPDDSLRQQLFTSDLLGNEWSQPQMVRGINEGLSETSYPFMLSDGITLYFAGKGIESIGGYDIFFTRYDSHSSSFLQPENIGMPFNSEANDYLYVIDEFNQIGYFVSDRRQPEGKVCIYIFVPSETRNTYDTTIYTEQQMRDFADITRIADTWGNGAERKNAMSRLKDIGLQATPTPRSTDDKVKLIINDDLTYSSMQDFHSSEAANLYKELVSSRQRLEELNDQLEKARRYYQKADKEDKVTLYREILKEETDELKLNKLIKSLEKSARNAEIKVIN